jgi:hypothetical protein
MAMAGEIGKDTADDTVGLPRLHFPWRAIGSGASTSPHAKKWSQFKQRCAPEGGAPACTGMTTWWRAARRSPSAP